MKQFKGGRCTLNSGGMRPDLYMFRTLPSGRYQLVVLRSLADRDALTTILRSCESVPLVELQRRYQAGKYQGRMSASEFVAVGGTDGK